MENGYRLRVAFAVASIAAVSLYLTLWYNRRRKQKSCSSSCYLHAEQKPQYAFERVLADNSYAPFKHLKLTESNNEDSSNSHPFEAEITALLNDRQPETELITGNADLTVEKSFIWVETESQLEELVHVLDEERFFAVDTEQHSLRSFLGFTALIQVSTQTKDYLVDTIALHDYMAILRPVFANPSICKVFHGADNDVVWLQRDFHIYIVNLFDTAKACEVLSKPHKSLAYLLETYCGVTTNKILQREDWRQRPLSAEMIEYAQTDAHYLLYIAKCLISELKQKGDENSSLDDKFHFVLEANRRSNMICLQLYSKDVDGDPGESAAVSLFSHFATTQEVSNDPNEAEFQVLVRHLCAWRDLMARVHDESLRYVLSDQAIVNLANKAPARPTDIYDCIEQADHNNDLGLSSLIPYPSSLVSCHFDDICYVLQKKLRNPNNMFTITLKKCLGSNGSCPLSVFNSGLLVNSSLKVHLVHRQRRHRNHKPVGRKASRDLFVKKFSCKAPVYHNCQIYANDGRLLCYCDRRKLEWYLQRNLAKLVDEDPPAIMLLFEPKGRPEDEGNEFYIQSKKNICVGCGERSHYLRYRIIPSCYRMHFPEHLKSHRSHDIVLLCVDCHEVAHAAAEKYKRKIADEFRIPLYVKRVVHTEIGSLRNLEATGVSPLQLRMAAMALLRHGERMPSGRRKELIEIVRKYYGGREISEEDLESAWLIGMSPHDRRRLEKKRGSAFKHSNRTACQETARDTTDGATTNLGKLLTSKVDAQDCLGADEAVGTSEDSELLMNEHTTNIMGSELMANGPEVGTQTGSSSASVLDEISNCGVNGDHGLEEKCQLNGSTDLCDPGNGQIMDAKNNSKLSILGHGPHGKQVVDHLLKEYGEEGVREFCQRWRQVFVDALRPRFLPAGWNVKHSGRRDFGDFSVYNPMKKASSDDHVIASAS